MSDSIAIVQAFAELRYGAVVHTRENSVKYGHNLGQTLYDSNQIPHYLNDYLLSFSNSNLFMTHFLSVRQAGVHVLLCGLQDAPI